MFGESISEQENVKRLVVLPLAMLALSLLLGCSSAPQPDPAMPPLPPLSQGLRAQLEEAAGERGSAPGTPERSSAKSSDSNAGYWPLYTTMVTGYTTFGPTVTTKEIQERQDVRVRQVEFVTENAARLEEQVAQGRGEYLDTLLQLFGCAGERPRGKQRTLVVSSPLYPPPLRRRLAARILQESYPALYTQPAPGPEVLLVRMKVALAQDSRYAESCKYF